ncbi:MAG: MGMT family protein, partial [Thaumarchaeota archaeon]|nr:MGMT family protein [Nitrososphaerota archaeon]
MGPGVHQVGPGELLYPPEPLEGRRVYDVPLNLVEVDVSVNRVPDLRRDHPILFYRPGYLRRRLYRYSRFDSPIGTLFIGYSERGVSYLGDGRYLREFLKLHPEAKRDDEGAEPVLKELEEYFGGSRRKFDIKLDLKGSDFQLKVWREISKIPYGETRSYGQLARAMGMPKAYRAVGL